jgi:hypothetical protein
VVTGSQRLDTNVPRIAARFRAASAEARRKAAFLACAHAVASAEISGADVERALGLIPEGRVEPELRRRLEGIAAGFDDEYFRLGEQESDETRAASRRAFRKARAASALAFALVGDHAELHEAIYESLAACEDPAPLISRLGEMLA